MVYPPKVKKAIVLHDGNIIQNLDCLLRILEYFGIPFETKSLLEMGNSKIIPGENLAEYAVFASIRTFHKLIKQFDKKSEFTRSTAAIYLYASEDAADCDENILRFVTGITNGVLKKAQNRPICLTVSDAFPDLTGPMTGIQVKTRLGKNDFIFHSGNSSAQLTSIISAGEETVFFQVQLNGIPCFISTSSHFIDIDAPLTQGFYDVKPHFCSVVPLILFLKYSFANVIWQPVEHGACIIIDDPLLKPRYGCCDFRKLLYHMKIHGFTTDISFIPWNWWRTSERQGAFFRRESDHFSVSIHGCDHTAAEFGDKNIGDLAAKAHLARTRMKAHQKRCGIRHEPIMVFPQGVFSEFCPDVLKRAGYIAAVNTEISPVGNSNDETRIRDVWDVAITRFGSFPIFTRRYPDHGLENFAFDLLLGKPCIVVAHHYFFKNNFQELLDLVENLTSLRCELRWRPLAEVLRRAYRYRLSEKGQYEYWMYSSELWIEKKGDIPGTSTVRKREHDPA